MAPHDTIAEATRLAREIYDEPRDLHAFEQLYLSAVEAISHRFNSYRGTAAREYGFNSDAHKAICAMADRQEAKELREAVAAYKASKEAFWNDEWNDLCNEVMQAAE